MSVTGTVPAPRGDFNFRGAIARVERLPEGDGFFNTLNSGVHYPCQYLRVNMTANIVMSPSPPVEAQDAWALVRMFRFASRPATVSWPGCATLIRGPTGAWRRSTCASSFRTSRFKDEAKPDPADTTTRISRHIVVI